MSISKTAQPLGFVTGRHESLRLHPPKRTSRPAAHRINGWLDGIDTLLDAYPDVDLLVDDVTWAVTTVDHGVPAAALQGRDGGVRQATVLTTASPDAVCD
ncbi:hypothetical protein [Microbispora bryophytorum]|uniref:hypothetical protein n=1 Tax=Microbispora bryophytorum TaxID=1460882 RepID=UPI0033D77B47